MRIPMQIRWIPFAIAIPISLYVSFLGTVSMGFCSHPIDCWPHTFAWTLLAPCLFLAMLSLRATAIASLVLLVAHVFVEAIVFKGGLTADTLWGTDKGLDKCFWIVVVLLVISALIPKKSGAVGDDTKLSG